MGNDDFDILMGVLDLIVTAPMAVETIYNAGKEKSRMDTFKNFKFNLGDRVKHRADGKIFVVTQRQIVESPAGTYHEYQVGDSCDTRIVFDPIELEEA